MEKNIDNNRKENMVITNDSEKGEKIGGSGAEMS